MRAPAMAAFIIAHFGQFPELHGDEYFHIVLDGVKLPRLLAACDGFNLDVPVYNKADRHSLTLQLLV